MVENKITSAAFDDPRWMLIRASKIGIALTLTAGLISAIIIVTSPLAWWTIAALMAALGTLLALEISRLALLRPDSIIAFYLVTLDPENAAQKNNLGIRLRHRNGRDSEGRVRDGAFVMPWFMNIPYDGEKQTSRYRKLWPRVLPLWRDAVTLDDARRTRVKLRWH
jgi:uncharacterized protein (DUF58 family)